MQDFGSSYWMCQIEERGVAGAVDDDEISRRSWSEWASVLLGGKEVTAGLRGDG